MSRKTNDAGIALIKQWEGKRLTAYKDPVGVWTLGYGHTDAAGLPIVKRGMRITEAQADKLLRADLVQYETAVERAVTARLTDNQFAALVSFCFNVGPANFARSTLLKKLNAGDPASVPRELMKWNQAGGKVLPGLINRRAAEAGLWARGEFVASNYVEPSPMPKATGSMEGKGTVAATIGTAGAAVSEAVQQLSPLAGVSRLLTVAFVALTVLGVAVALYGVWARSRSDAGLA